MANEDTTNDEKKLSIYGEAGVNLENGTSQAHVRFDVQYSLDDFNINSRITAGNDFDNFNTEGISNKPETQPETQNDTTKANGLFIRNLYLSKVFDNGIKINIGNIAPRDATGLSTEVSENGNIGGASVSIPLEGEAHFFATTGWLNNNDTQNYTELALRFEIPTNFFDLLEIEAGVETLGSEKYFRVSSQAQIDYAANVMNDKYFTVYFEGIKNLKQDGGQRFSLTLSSDIFDILFNYQSQFHTTLSYVDNECENFGNRGDYTDQKYATCGTSWVIGINRVISCYGNEYDPKACWKIKSSIVVPQDDRANTSQLGIILNF